MKRVLVTGGRSFTARHLLPLLAASPESPEVILTDAVTDESTGAAFLPADLTDRAAVRALTGAARPDVVFHLAGVSSPEPDLCYAVNLEGTRNLLESCARLDPAPGVVLVSSAAVYGLTTPEENPVTERTPLRPVTAYGASKAAAEICALSMQRRGVLPVLIVRPFNLVGPGLREGFAPSDFVRRALAIRGGRSEKVIRVGNLSPRRDFVDVRDAVRAYMRLAELGCWGGVFNVASGRPVAIGDLLARVLETAGVKARVVEDPELRRPVEVAEQVGDASTLRAATGWTARIALEDSLREMVRES